MFTKKIILPVVLAFLGFTLFSCDKDFNTIGVDIIDDNHFVFGTPDRDATVVAYNEDLPIVQTDNLTINPLGIYRNSTFGTQTANFVTQLVLPSSTPSFKIINEDPEITEVVLYIPYFSTAGTTTDGVTQYTLDSLYGTSKLKLSVFENGYFLRDLDPSNNFTQAQKYYSNQGNDFEIFKRGAAADGTSVAGGERLNNSTTTSENDAFYFNNTQITETSTDDEGTETTKKLVPGMYFTLNKEYFQKKIIGGYLDGKLSNANVFNDYFRGLYFKVEPSAEDPNGSSLAMINFRGGKITIKYKEDFEKITGNTSTVIRTNKTLDLTLGGYSASLVTQNRTTEYQNALQNASPTLGDERLFINGGAGSMAIIDLFGRDEDGESAELENYRSKGWLINEANLTFRIDRDAMGENKEPQRIYLYDINNKRPILDYVRDQTSSSKVKFAKRIHSGIIVKEDDKGVYYKIRLTNHISNLLRKDSTNVRLGLVVTEAISVVSNNSLKNPSASGLKEVPLASVLSPLGTVLYGSKSSVPLDKRLKLEIYYTKPD